MTSRDLEISEFNKKLQEYPFGLKISEVSALLGISKGSVHRLANSGELKRRKFSATGTSARSVRITTDSLRDLYAKWMGNHE